MQSNQYNYEPLGRGLVARTSKKNPAELTVRFLNNVGVMVDVKVDRATAAHQIKEQKRVGFLLVSEFKAPCKAPGCKNGKVTETRTEGTEADGTIDTVTITRPCSVCQGTSFSGFLSAEAEAFYTAEEQERIGRNTARVRRDAEAFPGGPAARQRELAEVASAAGGAAAKAVIEGLMKLGLQGPAPAKGK